MNKEVKQLNQIREQLNTIDSQLLNLINQRMKLVKQVGEIKSLNQSPIYRPEREKEILDRLKKENPISSLLDDNAIDALFLEIFAISRNLELPENIAYLGPEGSFTHQAAESKFGAMSSYLPITSIRGVFREVANKKAKYGVVPIENSSNGIVSDTVACLNKYDLKIIAEVVLDIHHCFATKYENIKEIKTIYSKDIAFEQCHQFLEDFDLNRVEFIEVESTAKGARLAMGKENSAAICSAIGAKIYNLPLLFQNIEDKKDNKTRFLIISNFTNIASGNDKTSILATLPNKQGELVRFLTDFDNNNINLTKIKSHIYEGISSFFIDFDGHFEDNHIKNILQTHNSNIKLLGSYVKEANDI